MCPPTSLQLHTALVLLHGRDLDHLEALQIGPIPTEETLSAVLDVLTATGTADSLNATRGLCRAYWTLFKEFDPDLKGVGFLPPDQINYNNLNTIEDLQQAHAAAVIGPIPPDLLDQFSTFFEAPNRSEMIPALADYILALASFIGRYIASSHTS